MSRPDRIAEAGTVGALTAGLTGAIVTPPPTADGASPEPSARAPVPVMAELVPDGATGQVAVNAAVDAGALPATSELPPVLPGTERGQSVAPTAPQYAPLPATPVARPARPGVSDEGAAPLEPDAPLIVAAAPTADRPQGAGRASAVAVQTAATVGYPEQAAARAIEPGVSEPGRPAGSEPADGATGGVAVPDGTLAAGAPALRPAPPSEAVAPLAEPVDAADGPQLAARLADTVRWAVQTGEREFRMRLNPPELGRLDVRVTETADGVRIAIDATVQEARELIQQQLPLLRLALEARELRVDRLDVLQPERAGAGETGDAPRGRSGGGTESGDEGELPEWSPVAAMEHERDPGTPETVPGSVERSSGTVDVRA